MNDNPNSKIKVSRKISAPKPALFLAQPLEAITKDQQLNINDKNHFPNHSSLNVN